MVREREREKDIYIDRETHHTHRPWLLVIGRGYLYPAPFGSRCCCSIERSRVKQQSAGYKVRLERGIPQVFPPICPLLGYKSRASSSTVRPETRLDATNSWHAQIIYSRPVRYQSKTEYSRADKLLITLPELPSSDLIHRNSEFNSPLAQTTL